MSEVFKKEQEEVENDLATVLKGFGEKLEMLENMLKEKESTPEVKEEAEILNEWKDMKFSEPVVMDRDSATDPKEGLPENNPSTAKLALNGEDEVTDYLLRDGSPLATVLTENGLNKNEVLESYRNGKL